MDFLNILEEFVLEVGGKDAIKLFTLLKEYENISEFTIAEELKLNINQIRNILYKLNEHNLVYSTRKKDREKGWYIYYWTFNFKHARDLLKVKIEKRLNEAKVELEKEKQNRFFFCQNGCIRVELEEALELEYKCNECGSILKQEDAAKKVNEIEQKINKLSQELEELSKTIFILPKTVDIEERLNKKIVKKKVVRKKPKKKVSKKKIKKKVVKKKLSKKKVVRKKPKKK